MYFEGFLSQMYSLFIPLVITISFISYTLPMCKNSAKFFINPVCHRILPKTELVEWKQERSGRGFSPYRDGGK